MDGFDWIRGEALKLGVKLSGSSGGEEHLAVNAHGNLPLFLLLLYASQVVGGMQSFRET